MIGKIIVSLLALGGIGIGGLCIYKYIKSSSLDTKKELRQKNIEIQIKQDKENSILKKPEVIEKLEEIMKESKNISMK